MHDDEDDAQIRAWLDQEDRHVAMMIRTHSVFIQSVGAEPYARLPAWSYTVGLFGLGHPELLAFDLSPGTAGHVFNTLTERIRHGDDVTVGEDLQVDGIDRRFAVEEVPNPGEIVFAANRFYQRPSEASVPVLQLTLSDDAGRFPWEAAYAGERWRQPRPGAFTGL